MAHTLAAGVYPGFCSMKRLEVFLLPLDGMLVHHRSLPRNLLGFPQQFASTDLYTWVERGTVRVKCLAQEHNTMSPARARTRGPFLESPDNLTGPKSYIEIKVLRKVGHVLTSDKVQFVSFADNFTV